MRHPAWWLVAAMLAGTAWALDPPSPAPAPESAEPAPADEEAPGGEETAAGEEEAAEPPAPPPEARSTGPTPQRFDPSEKVRADFPVSFPIDI
jgi:hypothetical protein